MSELSSKLHQLEFLINECINRIRLAFNVDEDVALRAAIALASGITVNEFIIESFIVSDGEIIIEAYDELEQFNSIDPELYVFEYNDTSKEENEEFMLEVVDELINHYRTILSK